MRDTKFDLNDIVLVPSEETNISSRSECYTKYKINRKINKKFKNIEVLPLMAAPMDTVISTNNMKKFQSVGIIPCIPRGCTLPDETNEGVFFVSHSLSEIEDILAKGDKLGINSKFVLIDIANGHMNRLTSVVKKFKQQFPHNKLMVGNIANPETFVNLGLAGADYVRCSIGTGNGCTTAENVSINYPLGSLISECYNLKKQYALKTRIVADGGMKNYSDVIKVLGLGADYVMLGSLLNKAIESAGFNYFFGIRLNDKIASVLWKWSLPLKKKYRGMSTKSVQRSWGKDKLVTAEGVTRFRKVEYDLEHWCNNFNDYLKSAMSYCNAKNLYEFIGKVDYIFITNAARDRFKK